MALMLLRRRSAATIATLILFASVVSVVPDADARGFALQNNAASVLVIADSVVLDAGDHIAARLPGRRVTVVGYPGVTVGDGPRLVSDNLAAVGDVAVVALGNNILSWDPKRYAREIDQLVEALLAAGAQHVVWAGVREPNAHTSGNGRWTILQLARWQFVWPQFNQVLRDALRRHPELNIANWDDIATDSSYVTDAIHLTAKGQQAMAGLLAQVVKQTPRLVSGTTTVPVAGRGPVPADATAALVRVNMLDTRWKTNVVVHACTEAPGSAQFGAGSITPAGTTAFVALGTTGEICVTASHATHFSVDVQGWTTSADGLVPNVGETWTGVVSPGTPVALDAALFSAGLVNETASVAVRVEARGVATNGSLRLHPCDAPRSGPALTFTAAQRSADIRLVAAGNDHPLCVSSSQRARVSVTQVASSQTPISDAMLTRRRLLRYSATSSPANITHRLTVSTPGAGGNPVVLSLRTGNAGHNGSVSIDRCDGTDAPSHAITTVPTHTTTATVVATPGPAGTLCATAPADADLVIDAVGVITPGHLQSVQPFQVFDSRLVVQRDPTIDLARQRPTFTDDAFGTDPDA